MTESEIDEVILEDLYSWVDQIALSRPKRDIKRDFSDGVLAAEIVKTFIPQIVEIHNYVAANKYDNKVTNWKLLNRKVFRKLDFELGDDVIRNISLQKPMAVEHFLLLLRRKLDRYLFERNRGKHRDGQLSDRPEVDQLQIEESPSYGVQPSVTSMKKTSISQEPLGLPTVFISPRHHNSKSELVSKILVEEKEQEILAKEETIQILTAKARRLEHLLHLKDIRIDDLQNRLDHLEVQLRPTAHRPPKR